MDYKVKIDSSELDELLRNPKFVSGPLHTFLEQSAKFVERKAKHEVPAPTGRLRASIESTVVGTQAIIEPTVKYAPYVEFGTRPHDIRPLHKKALAFKVGGNTIVRRLVHHPGTKPNPFMSRALEQSVPEIHHELDVMAEEIKLRWRNGGRGG